MSDKTILVINTGSSSLKFGFYEEDNGKERLVVTGLAEGIGSRGGKLSVTDAGGHVLRAEQISFASQSEALDRAFQWLKDTSSTTACAIGHRVVHGGPRLRTHQLLTPAVRAELEACLHFAPLHLPVALQLIDQTQKLYPQIPQFACFDTAFHATMPDLAVRLPLPTELFQEGIQRYGFHGLSYESIVHQLSGNLPSRTIVAHLGNGASLTALRDGRSIDTTMALTPTGGIPMATRSGDLDPGVLLYLLRVKQMDTDTVEKLLNHDSGLLALSGGQSDMRDLEAAAGLGKADAQLALDMFCMSIRKTIGAYAAVLGGLDMLVFTGGIGEYSSTVRTNVCQALSFLGIGLDQTANKAHENVISADDSKIAVRVVPSQEDLQISRHCRALTYTSRH
ncbi:MAG: acetate/propionate family kinase [Acidobacteriota bacterium]